ncbi:MAG: glycosyltransferase family 87 protein [Chitinophagaceae bacterium]
MSDLLRNIYHNQFFVCFLAALTCGCFYLLEKGPDKIKIVARTVFYLLFISSIVTFIGIAINGILHPSIWDFSCFYLYGKVAVGGYNFYVPENFQHVYSTLGFPESHYRVLFDEVLNVGFPYPPPTMLYFVSLGFLSYKAAVVVWTIFILFFAFGSIYLLYTLFFKGYKLNGLMLVSVLFLNFSPAKATLGALQTNFILLFYLLLMKKYSDKGVAGIVLSLAIFTKPYMAVFGLFFLLRKKWKACIYFAISTIIITGIAFAIFGKTPFVTYLTNNPSHRLPVSVFSEGFNQSLHAVLIRAGVITVGATSMYKYIAAGIMLFTIFYLVFLIRQKLYDYMLPVLLLIGLMVYPGTLSYYGVVLMFIMLQFFNERNQLALNAYITTGLIAVVFTLSAVSLFSCICLLLIVLIAKSLIWPRLQISGSLAV